MNDQQKRAERIAQRAISKGRDTRDRSDCEQLRIEQPPARHVEPQAEQAQQLQPVQLADRHHEPVEPYPCPRCGTSVESAPFYGPCEQCSQQLRSGATVAAVPALGREAPPSPLGGAVASGPVLRRQQRRLVQRSSICRDAAGPELGELLAELPAGVDRVLLTGQRPGLTRAGDRAWLLGELPPGWEHHQAGHYLEGANPVGKYLDPSGRRVELHRAAAWFGEGDYSPAQAEAAVAELQAKLHGLGVAMMGTPGTTGRALLLRVVPERDQGWPCLSPEHQDLVRSTSGQGRIELLTDGTEPPAQLHEYDGRWYYAGLCWGLGAGPATLDDKPTWEPRARGRYRVTFTVPQGWTGPGLLGVKDGAGWIYPSEPGSSWGCWADGAELYLLDQQGWPFTIHERLLLADSSADPLRGWAELIIGAAEGASELVRKALRMMLLATIGTLQGQPFTTTRVVELDDADAVAAIPPDAAVVRRGQQLVIEQPAAQAWPAMAHPEWSSAIWARGRARLLSGPRSTGALHLQAGQLVAFRTDAVYVTERQPSWEANDDGRPGRLTYKGGDKHKLPPPSTVAELMARRTWKG